MNRGSGPMVIATLPSRSVGDARRDAAAAARAGADVAEVRLDRWDEGERDRVASLFPSPLPLLATMRSRAEGGAGPDDAAARVAWRDRCRALPFEWIDLEADRDLPVDAGAAANAPSGGWIVSSHLAEGTPAREVHRRLAASLPPRSVAKVILPASVATALHGIAPELPVPGESRFIVHTTGPSGGLLRAWSRRLGLAGVYGCLPAGSASEPAVERSQIPVDRLRRFLDANGEAPLFAVVGRPIAHSRSPDLHHFWMEREHRDGLYIALEIASDDEFVDALAPLAEGGFRGLNVTHPFKDAALRAATRSGPGAVACGCANTLTFRDGEVEAENTDLLAILRRLEEYKADGSWDGSSLTLLGTGGSARATLAAARTLGVRTQIAGRRREAAAGLAREFGAEVAPDAATHPASLIVNATTVGRSPGGRLSFDLGPWIGAKTQLLDFVYRPDDPILAQTVHAAGGRYEDGRRLLGYAAAASYEIWWGARPAPQLVDAAIAEAA